MSILEIVLICISIISIGLAIFVYIRMMLFIKKFNKIFSTDTGIVENADQLIDAYSEKFESIDSNIKQIFAKLDKHDIIIDKTIKKIGLKRFNPFNDMGGDTSFIVVMLDSFNNGILLTNMTMRDGNRIYAKKIEKGTSVLTLSEYEQSALDEVMVKKA